MTKTQQYIREELRQKEGPQDGFVKDEQEVKVEWTHAPGQVCDFLKKFSSDPILKFALHSWDKGDFSSYDDFIKKITHRITMFGAIYLAVLAVIPMIIYAIAGVSLPFAASSLLIAVSVAMETMRELESQMLMRHYKGFLD